MDLDLTEAPQLPRGQDVDIEGAVSNALQKRTDLVQVRKNLEAQQINIRFYKDQLKPTLNAVARLRDDRPGWRAGAARAQTDNPFEPGRNHRPAPRSDSGASSATCSGSTSRNGRSARVFSMPLGRSTAEGPAGTGRLAYTQSELALRSQELSVATEVRSVGRNVNTNRRRVDSTRAARILT